MGEDSKDRSVVSPVTEHTQAVDLKAILKDLEEKAAAGDDIAAERVKIIQEALDRKPTEPTPEMLAAEAARAAEIKIKRAEKEARENEERLINDCKLALFENNSEQVAVYLQAWVGGRDFGNVAELEETLYTTGIFNPDAAKDESVGGTVPSPSRHEVVMPVTLRGEPTQVRIVSTAYHSRGGYAGVGIHYKIDAIRIIANPEALKH